MPFLLIFLAIVIAAVLFLGAYIVKQQTFVIIERLGKFKKIVPAGIHVKIPVVDVIAKRVDVRTHQAEFKITAKTKDNVNIAMKIAAQYRVNTNDPEGIYKSYYVLSNPIKQLESYIVDALRSAIPNHTLDEVYEKKDDIANRVNESVKREMSSCGYEVVSTLITGIGLPEDVEKSMNNINAAQREKIAAQSLADAEKVKVVTEAKAEAEAAEQAGIGIANQRKAIAEGISESLETIKQSGVTAAEANTLFLYTQWCEMMRDFAKSGKANTVVLPSDFSASASMFEQILAAQSFEKSTPEENTGKQANL